MIGPPMIGPPCGEKVLVHLASGIGNIILATPLLAALDEMGCEVTLALDADYPGTADLFRDWSLVRRVVRGADVPRLLREHAFVMPAIPPFYWSRFRPLYPRHANPSGPNLVSRPPDALFYRDEPAYYLSFAQSLGYAPDRRPAARLPIVPAIRSDISPATLVLAPGCKTGIMAAKRWPGFRELADLWPDVALVGTADDVDGPPFPSHVKSFLGRLTLRETAELMAAAGAVVANDSGLGHLAVAIGMPTILIFGPTPHLTLGTFPSHARVVRHGLPCEPCWYRERLKPCDGRIDCLSKIEAEKVSSLVEELLYTAFTDQSAHP